MIGYSQDGETVTLTMRIEDYQSLVLALGIATGTAIERADFLRWLALANRVNAGNPNWQPYEIPTEVKP